MVCLYRSGQSFWLSLSLPLTCALLSATGHAWTFVAITLLVIPVLDAFAGRGSPMLGAQLERSTDRQIPCWFALFWAAALGIAAHKSITAPPLQFIGLVIACGVLSATAMAHLHELAHRSAVPWRAFSDLAFTVAGYPHYRYAHELHHSHLGNPRFGSTASIGTSSWYHAGRSYILALKASLDPSSYKSRTVPRRLVVHLFVMLLLLMAPLVLGAWQVVIFILGYALISAFIVETVGYMQHYGFAYQNQSDAVHSWDVDFWLSNCLLVNNGYHGIHHDDGNTPYSQLAPTIATLPGGYFHMLWLSLVPPLWFSVMDRRVRVLSKRRRRQHVGLQDQLRRYPGEVS